MGTMTAETPQIQDSADVLHANTLNEMTSLISERLPYFRRIALRSVDNFADAEDAVQDAFLSAWKHLDKFKGEARMSTWLTVIVMNSARMVVRKRGRAVHLPLDGQDHDEESPRFSEMLPDASPDPEAQVRRRELAHRLQRLALHLSPNLREIIRLRGVEGLSIRETADILGLTESAVKTRAARARQELRRLDQVNPAEVIRPAEPRRRGRPRVRKSAQLNAA